jgi:hypothetical protein
MLSQHIAAQRIWFAVAPDGTEHEVVISVGLPTHELSGDWYSVVSVGCLDPQTYTIFGVDSWQAICLSMRFAATRLSHFIEAGWRFYWTRDGELAMLEDLAC